MVEVVPIDDDESETSESVALTIPPQSSILTGSFSTSSIYIADNEPFASSVTVEETEETRRFRIPSIVSPGNTYDWADMSWIESYQTSTANGDADITYKVIHLDNGLIRVTVSPDLGMRVLRVVDKTCLPERQMFAVYDDPANPVPFAQNMGGIKASFPYVENSTGLIGTDGSLTYKAGYFIENGPDSSISLVMNLRFEYNQLEADAGFLGKYGDKTLTCIVTLRPGRGDFEISFIAENENPTPRSDRLWSVACLPEVYNAGGEWLFPTKYAVYHLVDTIFDVEASGPLDDPAGQLDYYGSWFAL